MTPPTMVGVDPGGRETGIVVRQGDDLVLHRTIKRIGKDELPGRDYLREVAHVVTRAFVEYDVAVAIEGVQKPSPFMGKSGNVSFSNINGILGTAMVLGAIETLVPCFVIPPGGNGSGPLATYPVELRPTRGKGAGKDNLRHERSAWDVAGKGALLVRQPISA